MLYQLSYTRLCCSVTVGTVTLAVYPQNLLFQNFSHLAGTNCSAAFADSKTKSNIDSNRIDKINCNCNIITRHNHFCSFRKSDLTSNIKCPYVELRTVFIMEWSMASAFFFLKNINLSLDFCMRCD